jgi:hypothetical protein
MWCGICERWEGVGSCYSGYAEVGNQDNGFVNGFLYGLKGLVYMSECRGAVALADRWERCLWLLSL